MSYNFEGDMMNRKKLTINSLILVCIIFVTFIIWIFYRYNIIEHKSYSNSDFGIDTYISNVDKDNDGIDDQTDILNNVKQYIKTNPKYKSKYYAVGYPDDNYGVCTDVVGSGLLNAGYDLMELVNQDIKANKDLYNIDVIDKNIDFRRVRNLYVYFERNSTKLTNDIYDIKEWQGGDIIVYKKHIAIVSDKRNKKGISYIIHHYGPSQRKYEQDILENKNNEIIGHYRI